MAVDPGLLAAIANQTLNSGNETIDYETDYENVISATNATIDVEGSTRIKFENDLDIEYRINSGVMIAAVCAIILAIGILRMAYIRKCIRRQAIKRTFARCCLCCCQPCAPEMGKNDIVVVVPTENILHLSSTIETQTIATQTRPTPLQRLLYRAVIATTRRSTRHRRAKKSPDRLQPGESQTNPYHYNEQLPVLYDNDLKRVRLGFGDNPTFVEDGGDGEEQVEDGQQPSTSREESRKSVVSLPPHAKEAIERIQQSGMFSSDDTPSTSTGNHHYHHNQTNRSSHPHANHRQDSQPKQHYLARQATIAEHNYDQRFSNYIKEESSDGDGSPPRSRKSNVPTMELPPTPPDSQETAPETSTMSETRPYLPPSRYSKTNGSIKSSNYDSIKSIPSSRLVVDNEKHLLRRKYSDVSLNSTITKSTIINMQNTRDTVVVHQDQSNNVTDVEVGNPTS